METMDHCLTNGQVASAERSVLGSVLRDNLVLADVLEVLSVQDFYADAHRKLWDAMLVLHERGKPIDLETTADVLHQRKLLDDVGSYGYLAELWDAAPTAAHAVYYARIVREKSILRSLYHAGSEIVRDAYEGAGPAEEILEAAEGKILSIAEASMAGSTVSLEQATRDAYDRIDARSAGELTDCSGLPTGWIDLDDQLAGLQNGELITVAARTSVGKTAWALNLARHVAKEQMVNVFFVSLEQSRVELAERLLCCEAKVNGHKLRKGMLSEDEIRRLTDAGRTLPVRGIFIDDTPGQKLIRIIAQARRLKLRHNIGLVIVDYLQMIEPESRKESRAEQVGAITRRLKFLARDLSVPVVALAQLSRAAEQHDRPRLSDLRESGSIEMDSDTVLLMHRPDASDKGTIEVLIEKQRNGPTGEVTLTFRREFGRFENYASNPFQEGRI